MGILKKIFKSYSDREVKRIQPLVKKINDLEKEIQAGLAELEELLK